MNIPLQAVIFSRLTQGQGILQCLPAVAECVSGIPQPSPQRILQAHCLPFQPIILIQTDRADLFIQL